MVFFATSLLETLIGGRGGTERLAFAVFIKYRGTINYQMPAHILDVDLDAEMESLNELRALYGLGSTQNS
jgi:hypothetical protein